MNPLRKLPLALIPLLVSLVPATVSASSTFYGTLSLALGEDAEDNAATQRDETKISLDDSYSLIGFSNVEELESGFMAGARYELLLRADDGEVDTDDGLAYVTFSGGFGQLDIGRVATVYRSATDHGWLIDDSTQYGDNKLRRVSDAIAFSRRYGAWDLGVLGVFDGGLTRQQIAIEYARSNSVFSLSVDRESDRFDAGGQPLDDIQSFTLGVGIKVGESVHIKAAATQFDLNEAEVATLQAQQPGNLSDDAYASAIAALYTSNGSTFMLGYENGNWELEDDERVVMELSRGIAQRTLAWLGVSSAEAGSTFRLGIRHSW